MHWSVKNDFIGNQLDPEYGIEVTNYELTKDNAFIFRTATVNLSVSKFREAYYVKYYTIFDALSYLGGLLYWLTMLLFFVNWHGGPFLELFMAYSCFGQVKPFSLFGYVQQH